MPATPRRPLNVRLPADILEQIEADGGKKQAIVEDALRAWFDDSKDDSRVLSDANKENGSGRADDSTVIADDSRMIAALTGQLGEKDRQIAAKDEQLAAALVLLHDAITPPLQLPAAEPEAQAAEDGGRRWWQFWRKV